MWFKSYEHFSQTQLTDGGMDSQSDYGADARSCNTETKQRVELNN